MSTKGIGLMRTNKDGSFSVADTKSHRYFIADKNGKITFKSLDLTASWFFTEWLNFQNGKVVEFNEDNYNTHITVKVSDNQDFLAEFLKPHFENAKRYNYCPVD